MELFISVLGIISAIITVALTNYYSKKNQLKFEERKLKEAHYINYINAISNNVISSNTEDSRNKFADCQNKLLLVGSADVVNKLMIFHDYIKPPRLENFSVEVHDQLLTDLIKAMRHDLFLSSKVNKKYPNIHLTGK